MEEQPVADPVEETNPFERAKNVEFAAPPPQAAPPSDNPFERAKDPETVAKWHQGRVQQRVEALLSEVDAPWEETAATLKRWGVDPEAVKPHFDLQQATEAGRAKASEGATVGNMFREVTRRMIPVASPIIEARHEKEYYEAAERSKRGEQTPDDIRIMGEYQGRQQVLQKAREENPWKMGLLETGSSIPKILGEAYGAGKVVGLAGKIPGVGRALGAVPVQGPVTAAGVAPQLPFLARTGQAAARLPVTTAAMPSMYLEHMVQKNVELGRDPYDVRALPTAFGLGMANVAVLGRLQGRMAEPGKLLNKVPTAAGRKVGAGLVGVGEQQVIDAFGGAADQVLEKEWQTGTKFGVVGQLAEGKFGEALRSATIQAITFTAFAALHKSKTKPMEAFKAAVDAGVPPEKLAEVGRAVEDAVKKGEDPAKPVEADKTPLGDYGRTLGETAKAGMPHPDRFGRIKPLEEIEARKEQAARAAKRPGRPTEAAPEKPLHELTRDEAPPNGMHYRAIQEAIEAGKPVPPEVLADYPRLAEYQQQLKARALETADNPLFRDGRPLEPVPEPGKPSVGVPEAAPLPPTQSPAEGEIAAPGAPGNPVLPPEAAPDGFPGQVKPPVADGLLPDTVKLLPKDFSVLGVKEADLAALREILGGKSLRGAAEELDVSHETVRNRLKSFGEKLGLDKEQVATLVAKVQKDMRTEAAGEARVRGERVLPTDLAHDPEETPAAGKLRRKEQAQMTANEKVADKFIKEIEGGKLNEEQVAERWAKIEKLRESGALDLGVMHRLFTGNRGPDPKNFAIDPDTNPDMPRRLPDDSTLTAMYKTQSGYRGGKSLATGEESPVWIAMGTRELGVSQAENVANAWYMLQKAKPNAFPEDANGQITFADGTKGWVRDAIEAYKDKPGAVKFTPEQKAFADMWYAARDKKLTEAYKSGYRVRDKDGKERPLAEMLKEGYFPLGVEAPSDLSEAWAGVKGRPGRKQSFEYERVHETQAEGVAKGTKYTGPLESARDWFQAMDTKILDRRLIDGPALNTKALLRAEQRKVIAQNKVVLDALPPAERKLHIQRLMGDAKLKITGNIEKVATAHRDLHPEKADALERMYVDKLGKYAEFGAVTLQEARGSMLGGDFSPIGVHLLSMIGSPFRWRRLARVLKVGGKSLFDSEAQEKAINADPDLRQALTEFTQSAGSIKAHGDIGQLGTGKSLIENLPTWLGRRVGGLYTATGRFMTTTLNMAKLETWKALRPENREEWPRFAVSIENGLGHGRMKTLGMSPERQFGERFFLLAPTLYRGFFKLSGQMFEPGAPGKHARESMASLATGTALLSLAGLYLFRRTGIISEEELEERMNPGRGKFLMLPVPMGDGKTVEIGFGGFVNSVIRAVGNANNYAEGETSENPLIRWYRGHAGIAPRLGIEIMTGKDAMGRPVMPGEALLHATTPIAVQQGLLDRQGGTPVQRATTTAAGLFGLKSHPGSDRGNHLEELRKAAQATYGKKYEDLNFAEQQKLVRSLPPKPKAESSAEKESAAAAGAAANALRAKRLTERVSPDTRAVLKEFNHPLPGYSRELSAGGVEIPLTKARQDRFEDLLVEEYDKVVKTWPLDKVRAMPAPLRDKVIQRELEKAKEAAKTRLIREVMKGSEVPSSRPGIIDRQLQKFR